jgi:hypothetical protein
LPPPSKRRRRRGDEEERRRGGVGARERRATMPEELTPEQIDEYWTRLGQMKKQFESFAKSYIKTLEQ